MGGQALERRIVPTKKSAGHLVIEATGTRADVVQSWARFPAVIEICSPFP